jgi:hypothetical protein
MKNRGEFGGVEDGTVAAKLAEFIGVERGTRKVDAGRLKGVSGRVGEGAE